MLFFIELLIVAFLFIVFIQDFRHKVVSLWLLILLFFFVFFYSFFNNGLAQALGYFFVNLSFVFVLLAIMYVYLKYKYHIQSVKELNTYFGYGDVFFLAISAFLFSFFNYVIFMLVSTIVSLLFFAIKKIVSNSANSIQIPFAGIMSVCLIICFISRYFNCIFNMYNDLVLVNSIYEYFGIS